MEEFVLSPAAGTVLHIWPAALWDPFTVGKGLVDLAL